MAPYDQNAMPPFQGGPMGPQGMGGPPQGPMQGSMQGPMQAPPMPPIGPATKNILELAEELKGWPADLVLEELENPTGKAPQYLLAAQAVTNADIEERVKNQLAAQQGPPATVVEDILADARAMQAPPQAPPGMGEPMPPLPGLGGPSFSSPIQWEQNPGGGMPPDMMPGLEGAMPPDMMPPGGSFGDFRMEPGEIYEFNNGAYPVRGFANGAYPADPFWDPEDMKRRLARSKALREATDAEREERGGPLTKKWFERRDTERDEIRRRKAREFREQGLSMAEALVPWRAPDEDFARFVIEEYGAGSPDVAPIVDSDVVSPVTTALPRRVASTPMPPRDWLSGAASDIAAVDTSGYGQDDVDQDVVGARPGTAALEQLRLLREGIGQGQGQEADFLKNWSRYQYPRAQGEEPGTARMDTISPRMDALYKRLEGLETPKNTWKATALLQLAQGLLSPAGATGAGGWQDLMSGLSLGMGAAAPTIMKGKEIDRQAKMEAVKSAIDLETTESEIASAERRHAETMGTQREVATMKALADLDQNKLSNRVRLAVGTAQVMANLEGDEAALIQARAYEENSRRRNDELKLARQWDEGKYKDERALEIETAALTAGRAEYSRLWELNKTTFHGSDPKDDKIIALVKLIEEKAKDEEDRVRRSLEGAVSGPLARLGG